MKLIQLNIWAGRLNSPIEEFFQKQAADIYCLQEVIDIPGGQGELFTALEEIVELANLSSVYFSPAFGFNYDRRHGRLGNLIAAKQDFASTHHFFTSKEYNPNLDHILHDTNMRNLQHVTFERPGDDLHVLNHHGYWVGEHKNGNKETLEACQTIVDYISKLKGQVILCGDFNLAPHSDSIELLNKALRNLSVEHRLQTTRTSLTHKREVCDYIFVNDSVKVKSFKALDSIVSDHKALVLEFD